MHTPGPWSADYGDFAVFCDTGAEIAAITPGNHDDGTAITMPEMEANLNLVAAAPGMLALVQDIVDAMDGTCEFEMWDDGWQELRRRCDAILSAHGEVSDAKDMAD